MERLIFTNAKGDSITFAYDGNDYFLDSWECFTMPFNSFTTSGYNQVGETFNYSLIGARPITINVWLHGSNMADYYSKRERLIALFNPLYGMGTLNYDNGAINRTIDCYASNAVRETERKGNLRLLSIELQAPLPYWYNPVENGQKLYGFSGGLAFPFKFDTDITFGTSGATAHLTNGGDVETPVRVEIKNQSCVNPRIVCGDKFIGINKTLTASDVLIIDTAYGAKSITINGVSAMRYLMDGSTFLQLPQGDSTITLQMESGNPDVFIYWRDRFVGV